ncbi:MAG: MFS transporter, partial [Alphaproteobacteria bacterium]
MDTGRMKLAMLLTYFVFAILLNSVGTVILQSINSFGVSKGAASTLEGFKDISIATVSF